jgi:hypothetical protein
MNARRPFVALGLGLLGALATLQGAAAQTDPPVPDAAPLSQAAATDRFQTCLGAQGVSTVQMLVDATRLLAVSDCADIATETWRKADELDDGNQVGSGAHAAARFQLCVEHYGAQTAQQLVDRAQWFILGTTCTGYAMDGSISVDGLPPDAGPIEDTGDARAAVCRRAAAICADAHLEP